MPEQPTLRHRSRYLVILLVVVAAGALLIPTLRYHLNHVVTDDAYVTGNLVAISASVPGRVSSLYANEGDSLQPGQPMLDLADGTYRAESDRAQSAVARGRSLLAEAEILLEREKRRAGPLADQFEADLTAMQARLGAARAAREQAANTLVRVERMAGGGLVSDSDLENARMTDRRRKAELEEAEELVHKAVAAVKLTDGHLHEVRIQHQRVETARAMLASAEAEAVHARIDLENTHVISPTYGILARLAVNVGHRIDEGQTLAFVHSLDTLWVVANVEETQIRKVRIGQPVEITVDAFPSQTFYGTVRRIGTVTKSRFALIPRESVGGNFVKVIERVPVAIDVADESGVLKLGLSAVVGIDVRDETP